MSEQAEAAKAQSAGGPGVPEAPDATEQPEAPARIPPKPRPIPTRVEHPQRLRKRRKKRLTGSSSATRDGARRFDLGSAMERWFAAWVGLPGVAKPESWEDVPCKDRPEAAQMSLEAFRDWLPWHPTRPRPSSGMRGRPERL